MTTSAIAVAASFTAISWFMFEAIWEKAKYRNGFKVYSVAAGLRMLYWVMMPAFLYGAGTSYRKDAADIWVWGVLIGVAAFCFLAFPPTLLVSQYELIQVRWHGLKRIRLKWDEVDCVYYDPEEKSLIIHGRTQSRVVHTLFNVDRAGLIEQIYSLPSSVLSHIAISV